MKLFSHWKLSFRKSRGDRSARQRAFDLFSEGYQPTRVCKMLPISMRTACRYFESYKKLHNRTPISAIRKWMKVHAEFSEAVIEMLVNSLEMPREEVIVRLSKPYGLTAAIKGEWPNYRLEKERTAIEQRLLAALEVIKFADMFSHREPELVRKTLADLMLNTEEETGESNLT